jgi:HK97 family phage prohead protease
MPASRSDERIVCARLVPYNTVAYVADPPRLERRAEIFHTDAFRDQLVGGKPATVSLDVAHQRDAPVGHAVELKNLGSSLFGAFRIHNTHEGDEALERIHNGTLTSVSIRFTPLARRDVDGVRQHRRAYLDSVALTATPVYPEATILGVRKGSRRERSDPSARERVVLNLERLDQKLGALISEQFEEWFAQRQLGRRLVRLGIHTHPRTPGLSPYTKDPRYQRLERLRTDVRASLQQLRQHQPCRPDAARTLRRDCGEILQVR